METDKIVAGGLALLASKDVLGKLLGPTADYLGAEIKNVVQRRLENLNRVFLRALKMLGPKVEEPGAVNPRVLKHVVEEGQFSQDEVHSAYLAGLLASSRTRDGKDDRAVPLLAALATLSRLQVRTHYLIYSSVRRVCGFRFIVNAGIGPS
jgi:hypothetical protein